MKLTTGDDVRKCREELMLGKAELAKMAGLSAQTLHRIESGQKCRYPSLNKIIKVLRQQNDQCRDRQEMAY